jgi:energy-coupling factor transport system permease protein
MAIARPAVPDADVRARGRQTEAVPPPAPAAPPNATPPPDSLPTARTTGRRVPRALHPVAWWIWALGLATAVTRTTNPLLLLLVLAVLGYVVSARRGEAPWARAFKYYLWMALTVIAIRILLRTIFAGGLSPGDHVLFTLPRIRTPGWYTGIQIGGPVGLEATLSAAVDGLRLACLLCCIGAANTLANPKRALRILPGALYELGVAVTVSLSVAPQLVESTQRVARARRLRAGRSRGLRALRSIVLPVFTDALERSLRLAAAMDSRGYGRTGPATRRTRRVTAALISLGMLGLCVGAYGLLDGSAPRSLGLPAMLAGSAFCCAGLVLGGRRVRRTAYRPDPWLAPEWIVAGCGIAAAGLLLVSAGYRPAELNPSFHPLGWPPLPLLATIAILTAAFAAVAAPPPRRPVLLPARRAGAPVAAPRPPSPDTNRTRVST